MIDKIAQKNIIQKINRIKKSKEIIINMFQILINQ